MKNKTSTTLTPSLTELSNRYHRGKRTKGQRKFLKIAYDINTKQKTTFCVVDFTEKGYTTGNFRQYMHKLKDMFITVARSKPFFYQLKGITLSKHDKKVTDECMGVGVQSLENMLEHMKDLPIMMHNIGLKFKSDNLHVILKNNRSTVATSNSMIKLKHFFEELDSDVTFTIYPKSVQVYLANTQHPIIRDPVGILKLGMVLGHVRQFLKGKSHELATIPLCGDWIVYHYHLNKDGPSCKGKTFEITVSDFDSTLMRFYKKQMDDGTTKNRIETILTPCIPISKLFKDTFGSNEKNHITINFTGDYRIL